MHTPYITDRICALICRPHDGIFRARTAFIIRNGSPSFESVAEYIETRTCVNCRWHSSRVQRINETESWLQCTMCNSRLCFCRCQVKNCLNQTTQCHESTAPVVSDPVPAVVGMAISGDNFFLTGIPFPNGALTKSRNSASG